MKKKGGIIEEWAIIKKVLPTLDKASVKEYDVVVGRLNGDPRVTWNDESPVRTSPIVKIDLENSILETENTIYGLGERHPLNNYGMDGKEKFLEAKTQN